MAGNQAGSPGPHRRTVKILHIGKYFSPFHGGVESYLRDAMVSLASQGVECAALVHQHEKSGRSSQDWIELDGKRFKVVRAGVVFNLSFTPVSPSFPVLLGRLLKSFKPDIMHLHLPNPSALWVLASLRARKIPWIVHWHSDVIASSVLMKVLYSLYRPFEQGLLKRSAAIVATSETYRASVRAYRGFRKSATWCHWALIPGTTPRARMEARCQEVTPRRKARCVSWPSDG